MSQQVATSDGSARTQSSIPRSHAEPHEPTLSEVAEALSRHVDHEYTVHSNLIELLICEQAWSGRTAEVLALFADDEERLAYRAGGRRPDEIVTWLSQWVDSPLSVEEIRLVLDCGGWDPDPFTVFVGTGLLNSFLYRPDGSRRRIRGELAGAWLSDEFALAGEADVLAAIRSVIDSDKL